MEEKLHGLVVPGVNAATEAGKLLENLPQLWEKATAEERRSILLTMLDAVSVDALAENAVVAIRPKPAFKAFFALATTQEHSGGQLHQPKSDTNKAKWSRKCSEWRRRRSQSQKSAM